MRTISALYALSQQLCQHKIAKLLCFKSTRPAIWAETSAHHVIVFIENPLSPNTRAREHDDWGQS
jgi:hypothetical protein